MTAGKIGRKYTTFIMVAAILLSSPLTIYADYKDDILRAAAGNAKDYVLAKARVDLIARLEKTQPELAGFLKEIDAPTWGRWAGEISARHGNVVFDEIVQILKKAATAEIEKKKNEFMKDMYKKGKKHAIEKGLLGEGTKTYIEYAEYYEKDVRAMAEKTYEGDFRGAGDVVIKRMKEELQDKAKSYIASEANDAVNFLLKDMTGMEVGPVYLEIIKIAMTKIDEFAEYTTDYFGKFPVELQGGKWIERDFCTQYMEMRKRGHNSQNSFYTIDPKAGNIYGMGISLSELVEQGGFWYGTSETKKYGFWGRDVTHPDAQSLIKKFELCYSRSNMQDKQALQALIDKGRSYADSTFFGTIKEGMEQRREEFITIINSTGIPTFSLVVTVLDSVTDKEAPGATVTLGSDKRVAPLGIATYAGLGRPGKIGDSITVTAEAKGYESRTQSFTFRELADKFDENKLEVQVKFPLKSEKKLPEDFTIDVTVTDKKTGNKISGAKVTLDGEAKDTANGVASYARKSSMLAPANSSNAVRVTVGAAGYKQGTVSPTVGELAGKLNKDTNKVEIAISLEPEVKVDEVDRFKVRCTQKEIFEDGTSTCNATVYLKSGKTRDVSAGSKWTPDFVDSFKGTVKGQEVKAKQPLPYTVKAESKYAASAEEGGKEWIANDNVLIKPLSAKPQPKIGIEKSADKTNVKEGERVTYAYTVTNPGNTGLDGVKVTDDRCSPVRYLGGDVNNNRTLDSSETWTYECSAVLNTTTKNTATAEGDSSGRKVTEQAAATVTVGPAPLSDEVDRLEVRCSPGEIFEDGTATCSATVYLKSGKTRNVSAGAKWTPGFVDSSKGTVKGREVKAIQPLPYTVKAESKYAAPAEEGGKEWIANDNVLIKPLSAKPQPKIGIEKSADKSNVKAGEKVTYVYKVTNPGKTALDSVKVTDDKCSPVRHLGGDANNNRTLDTSETWTYECSAALNTTTKNTATAEGDHSGQKVTEQATATVTVGPPEVGKVVKFEVICGPAEIFEDEVAICNAKVHYESGKTKDVSIESNWTPGYVQSSNGTVRGDEVKKIRPLPYKVTAEATYKAPPEAGGKSWVGNDNVVVKPPPVKKKAGIKIQKAVDATYLKPGETATYAYSVTNTGEVELNTVKIADDKCSPVKYLGGDKKGSKTLGPNDTWTYECSAVLKATTANTAVVEASTPSNEKVTDKATAMVTVAPCPPPKVLVPYVIDRTEGDAITELKKDSLQGKVSKREYGKRIKEGTVMEQDPAAGGCVDPDSVVGLVVSRGPEPDEPVKPAQLTAELDCGASFELAPGDVIGRTCGIIVRGWNSRTENRVEVKVEYDKDSGIEVFPGDTGAMGTQMYRAGIQEHPDRYIFSQHFTAKADAQPGKTTVAITVSQESAGSVKFSLDIAVLKKGLLPSTGPGIRPPAEAKQGSGGPYCVWRYKLTGDAPACFHFHVAACAAYPYRPAYELVGQNMTWGEADTRAGELSRYFSDQYGCEGAVEKPAGVPPPPAVVKQGSGGDRCVWRHHPFGFPPACFEFHNAPCTAYSNRKDYELVGQNMRWGEADARIEELSSYFKDAYGCQAQQKALADCSRIKGSTLVTDKASGNVSCQCPGGTMLNKAGDACIPNVQTQIGQADCSDLPGTSPRWDPGWERVDCVCPEGTKWFEKSCKTDKDIKFSQTDCSGRPGTSPQWDPGIEQWSCECPSGTQWYKNACTSEKDIKIAEADCSMYSGTSPQWNEAAGRMECICSAGTKWVNDACVKDAVAQADCSGMPGTSPQLDEASGKVLCVCPTGTKWFNNACVRDKDIKVAQADCSGMPGTSPKLDEASGKVLCVCPAGTMWNKSRQMCLGEEKTQPATTQGATTPGATKDFYVVFKVHMSMPKKWPQLPKVPADADDAAMERYRKQVKQQLEAFANSLTLANTVIEQQAITKTALCIHLSGAAISTYKREIFANGEKFALPFNGSGKDPDGKAYIINGAILLTVAGTFDAKEKAQAAYPAVNQVIEMNSSNGTFVHQKEDERATGGPLVRGWSQANLQKSLALTKLFVKIFGKCFVATVVYGDAFAPELDVLRQFRDTVLMSSVDGFRLVKAYYKYGPLLAEKVRRYPFVIRPLKAVLNSFVGWLRHADQDNPVTRTATRIAVKVAWKVVSLFVKIEPDAAPPGLPFNLYPYRIKATTDRTAAALERRMREPRRHGGSREHHRQDAPVHEGRDAA